MLHAEFWVVGLVGALIATLQLGPGTLLLLYHASLGRHIRARTRLLTRAFIVGNALMTLLILTSLTFMVDICFNGAMPAVALAVTVEILAVFALLILTVYYRRPRKSTELWLPRNLAKYLTARARATHDSTEAFLLGMLAALGELPFTLILMLLAGNAILEFSTLWQGAALLLTTLIAILPLIIMKGVIRSGHTVVEVQKWRAKNLQFLRIIAGAEYLVLAGFVLAFQIF